MAEMSTGQPDPRSGARPAASDPFPGEALDFLGLDQAFAADPGELDDSAAWQGAEPGVYDDAPDFDGLEEGAWEADPEAFEGAPQAGYDADHPGLGEGFEDFAADPNALEGLEDPDFDFEEAEVASWLMELEDGALEDLAQFDLESLDPVEPPAALDFPLPPPPRSPWLLAAVIVLSVGAGVGLSKALSRFNASAPAPGAPVALGPRTPAPAPRANPTPPPAENTPAANPVPDPTEGTAALDPSPLASSPEPLAAAPEPGVQPEPTVPGAAPEPGPLTTRTEPPVAVLEPTPLEPRPTSPTPRVVAATPPAPGGTGRATPGPAPARTAPRVVPAPEPVALAPLRGPVREASAEDLAGLWSGTTIPLDAIDGEEHLATPFVGRVRIVARNGEIFEGRLHGLGRGRVWFESGQAKMALMGWQVSRIEHVLGDESTPALGQAGSQHLAGLPSVRVRTPGGVFYGKLISQEGARATLMTAEGARVILDGGIVEPAGKSRTRVVEVLPGEATDAR